MTKIADIHPSWLPFITPEIKELLIGIRKKIGSDFTPKEENVLRFLKQDLMQKKIILLGQDPYYQPDVANGRSFQPDNLNSWDQPYRQVSLKNIIRGIYKAYCGDDWNQGIKSYESIMQKKKEGLFPILEPKKWFDDLEKQGVLFLNISFTCKVYEANSHRDIWRPFSEKLICYIASKNPELKWFLWGKEAQNALSIINHCSSFKCNHPMMCNESNPYDFLNSNCFLQTKSIINWLGNNE